MQQQIRRLPAEWDKHKATLLSFPHEGCDWPGKYNAIQWAFVEIIRRVTQFEPIILIVKSDQHRAKVIDKLQRAHVDLKQITFIMLDTNRSWMRDSGPVVVHNSEKGCEALQFGFNGWAKYPNHLKDRKIPAAVANALDIPLTKVTWKGKPVILEGGAIDHNGQGTLVTTEECLLHPTQQVRNPGFAKKDYEAVFAQFLGIKQVIWLGDGIDGDDTHGHVDDICRFVNANTVVAAKETNTKDPNHKKLESNLERLQNITLANGKKLDVVTIPMPGRIDFEDMRLPASYVNFIFTNGGLLVPTFNDPNDYKALGILNELFPSRKIVGINATDLIWGLGTLHCLSHEIPAV
jgi:agmatine deiminase